MKSRLSSTVWLLVIWVAVAAGGASLLAFYAGTHANGTGIGDAAGMPTNASTALIAAVGLCATAALSLVMVLTKSVLTPVEKLAEFSERFANGDNRVKIEISARDEFGAIADNLNRSVAKISTAVNNQQVQESLQRSITDLLNVINQVARGDLTLRGKVTNDALGNVVDSVNYMLDNFSKVLERVRKAAVDVNASAGAILVAADQMTTGATQQDQEITEYFVGGGRVDRVDEASVEQRRSQRGSSAARARCGRARQPLGARYARRHAAHSSIGAGDGEENQVAGRPLAGNFGNHQRD